MFKAESADDFWHFMRRSGMADRQDNTVSGVDVTPQRKGDTSPIAIIVTDDQENQVLDRHFHVNVRLSGDVEAHQIAGIAQTKDGHPLPMVEGTKLGRTFKARGRREIVKATYYWLGPVALVDETTVRSPARVWQ